MHKKLDAVLFVQTELIIIQLCSAVIIALPIARFVKQASPAIVNNYFNKVLIIKFFIEC